MMNIIGCLDLPDEGTYLLEGLPIEQYSDRELARIRNKKIGFISAIVFLFFCILANIFASTQKADLQNHSNAIIMAPSITVKSTPNDNGTELFILHEGRKVIIKDNTMKEWKEIQLEDGNAGWVPAQAIEII